MGCYIWYSEEGSGQAAMYRFIDCGCSAVVKTVSFKTYCLCLYDASLWKPYNLGTLVNVIIDVLNYIFFGFKRRDSLTNILMNVGLPSFDTILHNAAASFMHVCNSCTNHTVVHLRNF